MEGSTPCLFWVSYSGAECLTSGLSAIGTENVWC